MAPLKICDRFIRAGMENEYRSLYAMFSNDAHNNLQALLARHIKIQDEDFIFVLYNDERLNHLPMYIGLISEYFTLATEKVHTFFNSLEHMRHEVSNIRNQLNNINKKHIETIDI